MQPSSRPRVRRTVAIIAAAILVMVVAPDRPAAAVPNLLNGPSPFVGFRHYIASPASAPADLRRQFAQARNRMLAAARTADRPIAAPGLFNRDTVGLPQNEESIAACTARSNVLLGGTNDYRYILDPQGNSTGWHLSLDGGRSISNEGLLPAIAGPDGSVLPSGGDPVDAAADDCTLYAASLNYDFTQPFPFPSGVGLYRSSPGVLAGCPQGRSRGGLTNPSCWPTRRLVDFAAPGHFLDKEWMTVGVSGGAGRVVWIAYGDLSQFNAEGNEESGVIKAVRCSADLRDCSAPIVLSEGQTVAEYPTITVGEDGRTYVTWGEFFGGSFIGPTQRAWLAVAEPGSLQFRRQPIVTEDQVMRGHETLHANDFRTGTMFKSTVAMVAGKPRVFVTWERCQLHAQDSVCEEPEIRLTWSDDFGRTWSPSRVISNGGDNYFPFITADRVTGRLVATWYTHRFDRTFHNRQDVELAVLNRNGVVTNRRRVTPTSNETEADPILHGAFIGDYFQVAAHAGRIVVHYNANYRSVRLIDEGIPLPQQDNYLAVLHQ
jgi:hypothetical protein